jgi:hypothetical protein
VDVEEQLEREARGRRPAMLGAALAAVLLLAGVFAAGIVNRANRSGGELTGGLLYIHRHAGALTLAGALDALGHLALLLPLRFLFEAVKYRRPEVSTVARVCASVGPPLAGVAQMAVQLLINSKAGTFASTGGQTYEQGKDLMQSADLQAAQAVWLAGTLAIGFAFVIIALNAMRVGLLTRFMGILGVIVGVLFMIRVVFVTPIGSPVSIVQPFWLGALAFLLSGRWPNGVPPAWSTGRAEPWPSQQEVREQREREKASPPARARVSPAAAESGAAVAGAPVPSSRKRKRKKRR